MGDARRQLVAEGNNAVTQTSLIRVTLLRMQPAISIQSLTKTYTGGFQALKSVNLEINRGEIFALLGPNGAGKTTLINIVCGIVTKTQRHRARRRPRHRQGLSADALAHRTRAPGAADRDHSRRHGDAARFSRGLFGKPPNPEHIEKVLKSLSLWDKKDQKIMMLSGGMKRRVLIAKALAHEPEVLFLDEPTAGVDVELRQDMWNVVTTLRESGVTVILTTHYIEEAEQLADRVGVINHGEIIIVQDKERLMRELGKKELVLQLSERLARYPSRACGLPSGTERRRARADLSLRHPARAHRHHRAARVR